MTDPASVAQLPLFPEALLPPKTLRKWPSLHSFWRRIPNLPAFVRDSPTIQRILELLGPFDWDNLPDRDLPRNWGQPTLPYAALVAAELIRLNEDLPSTRKLRRFLKVHPGFIWLLGFPLVPAPNHPPGYNPQTGLPTQRHLNRLVRRLPNTLLQFLLADSVRLILAELPSQHAPALDCVSLDTKHILAWVKVNNPKAYVTERFNKNKQPRGDPDCRLGCKRRHNRTAPPATPTRNPRSAKQMKVGEYYWGYGSGIVVAKVAGFCEFVIAELTQPLDQADVTYFFPLMQQTEERRGYRPRYATCDAAFAAWYVYAYFCREYDPNYGFAAVPFVGKGNYQAKQRQFASNGWPLCKAGLAMPLQFTYTDRTTCSLEHERGKYICPLIASRRSCPIRRPN